MVKSLGTIQRQCLYHSCSILHRFSDDEVATDSFECLQCALCHSLFKF